MASCAFRGRSSKSGTSRGRTWLAGGGLLGALLMGAYIVVGLLRSPDPPTVHIDPVAGQLLKSQLDAMASGSAGSAAKTVRADETALNSFLNSYLHPNNDRAAPRAPSLLSDVKVGLDHDRMRVYLLLAVGGQKLAMDIEGKVHSANGFVQFDPLRAQVGHFRVPQSVLENSIKSFLASPQSRESFRLPNGLRDLRIEESKLVLVSQ